MKPTRLLHLADLRLGMAQLLVPGVLSAAWLVIAQTYRAPAPPADLSSPGIDTSFQGELAGPPASTMFAEESRVRW
jgi:hypothetical protein